MNIYFDYHKHVYTYHIYDKYNSYNQQQHVELEDSVDIGRSEAMSG